MANTNLYARYVEHAGETIDFDETRDIAEWKREIIAGLQPALRAVRAGTNDWSSLVVKGVTHQDDIFDWRAGDPLKKWFKSGSDDALYALRTLWEEGATLPDERIRSFFGLVPEDVPVKRKGTGLRPVSVLLMALGPDYSPYKSRQFSRAYEETGHPEPPQGADEGALYEHSLAFLDKLVQSGQGMPTNRLEAESMLWQMNRAAQQGNAVSLGTVSSGTGPSVSGAQDLEALAGELLWDVEHLDRIERLLRKWRQVIFRGPPGTGKTYVAQKLAECLAESFEVVQFHPSYAYEDFVQGFRPTLEGGRQRFKLRDGPLLRMAERARRSEENEIHVLVIDEINRGNLAKVFGELYFLLEYRNTEIRLQYADSDDERFSLPENLWVIGTMNTADRSIALVDLALRRRFPFVEFHPDKPPIEGLLRRWLGVNASGMEWVAEVVARANDELSDRDAAVGPSYFMSRDGHLDDELVEVIWEHRVLPYIEEQLYGEHGRMDDFDLDKLRSGADRDSDSAEEQGGVQGPYQPGGDASD